jgi:regulatory protein
MDKQGKFEAGKNKMIQRKQLTKEKAIPKIRHYCGYQERCHSEVREKLYSFGLWKKDVEEIISQLIEEKYLDEERFALLFAGSKFRQKNWGRVKIKYELKQRQVSAYCVKKAIDQIDEAAYQKALEKLASAKWKTLEAEKNNFSKKRKLHDYLLQKGYEFELINKVMFLKE